MVDVRDMLTIDVIDDGLVYGLESIEGSADVTESEILDGPSACAENRDVNAINGEVSSLQIIEGQCFGWQNIEIEIDLVNMQSMVNLMVS